MFYLLNKIIFTSFFMKLLILDAWNNVVTCNVFYLFMRYSFFLVMPLIIDEVFINFNITYSITFTYVICLWHIFEKIRVVCFSFVCDVGIEIFMACSECFRNSFPAVDKNYLFENSCFNPDQTINWYTWKSLL